MLLVIMRVMRTFVILDTQVQFLSSQLTPHTTTCDFSCNLLSAAGAALLCKMMQVIAPVLSFTRILLHAYCSNNDYASTVTDGATIFVALRQRGYRLRYTSHASHFHALCSTYYRSQVWRHCQQSVACWAPGRTRWRQMRAACLTACCRWRQHVPVAKASLHLLPSFILCRVSVHFHSILPQ